LRGNPGAHIPRFRFKLSVRNSIPAFTVQLEDYMTKTVVGRNLFVI